MRGIMRVFGRHGRDVARGRMAMASDFKLGIEAYGGLNTYRMHDLNDGLKELNDGFGTDFKAINRGSVRESVSACGPAHLVRLRGGRAHLCDERE